MIDVSLVHPFPRDHYPLLWKWLNENKNANFDDFGPRDFESFEREMDRRQQSEELIEIMNAGAPVGCIGYVAVNPHVGQLHGICFSSRVCGTAITRTAVSMFLDQAFRSGVHKICASYFQSNLRAGRFLQKMGAVVEGLQLEQTLQHGRPVHAVMVAFFDHDI